MSLVARALGEDEQQERRKTWLWPRTFCETRTSAITLTPRSATGWSELLDVRFDVFFQPTGWLILARPDQDLGDLEPALQGAVRGDLKCRGRPPARFLLRFAEAPAQSRAGRVPASTLEALRRMGCGCGDAGAEGHPRGTFVASLARAVHFRSLGLSSISQSPIARMSP